MPHVHGQTKLKTNKILGFPYYILPLSKNIIPVGHVPSPAPPKKRDFSTETAVVGERHKVKCMQLSSRERREGGQR